MTSTVAIEVRHPYVGEVPASLIQGFEAYKINSEWQWVLVVDGRVMAQLLCCNAHGVLMMLRLTSLPDAPRGWAVTLFRRVLDDCLKLGMIGYLAFLGDASRAERRLMRIISRQGGYLVPVSGVWAAGRLENHY